MKRIKQLLSKGLDHLSDEEMIELRQLLSPDGIKELSPEDLVEVRQLLHDNADALLDADANDDATLALLEELANLIDTVKAEQVERDAAAADREAAKQALRDRLRAEAEENGPEDPPEDPDAPPHPDDPELDENGDPIVIVHEEPAVDPVPVAAAVVANSGPVITRIAVRRPPTSSPRGVVQARQAAMTAAAGLPGVNGGQRLTNDQQLFAAWDGAVQLAMRGTGVFKMPIVISRTEIPDELQLDHHEQDNYRKIEARYGEQALVAAGGACAPVPYRYDLSTYGDTGRPVRDALARFGAQRGGVSLFTPPTMDDVDGTTGGTGQAVSEWTYDNDVNPTAPTTKPYLRINCGSNTPTVTRVNAIIQSWGAGNMMDRWYPELISAYQKLIAVWHDRFAEAKLLATLRAGSRSITHGQVLGSATDIFTSMRQLIAGIRYRHRITAAMPIRVIGFDWVRQSVLIDLIRRGNGDRPLEERLAIAEVEMNSWFRAMNVNITWSPDFEWGRTVGQTGGPLAGVQGAGAVIGFPSVARFYVFLEGSWLFLDGGEMRLGVIRDSTLVGTNDFLNFSETFENAAYNGPPLETYYFDIDICAGGQYTSATDIAVCVSNS